MTAPAIPRREPERLAALARYEILDTTPEDAFDELARLASVICGTPIALVSLVDASRQWFKARVGLDATETPRSISFCGHAIHENDLFIVPDALDDPRFAMNPLVTGEPNIRFYAGAQLTTPDGENLGTLCVIDCRPRRLDVEQRTALRTLARQVIVQLELRRIICEQQHVEQTLSAERDALERLKNNFVSMVSHELRTPITSIRGSLGLLASGVLGELPADAKQMVTVAERNSVRLMTVVNDILDFERPLPDDGRARELA
jgi:GAF domain-containing protein